MSDKKTITEMLQYAVSIVEQQIAERGDMRLGEKEGEHWEVLLIACAIKDGQGGTLHASSSESPEQACYIAAQFLARAEDPRFSRHAPPPPKVV